ncbi:MAG: hypothetical protein GY953_28105 [bacterium]|nr:hypothetical protein [bacterium]
MELDDTLSATDIPRGIFQGKVGPSGRLKLPAQIYRYLIKVGDDHDKVFVTTVDLKTVRIYTLPAWKRNQQTLSRYTEDPKAAEAVLFVANAMGRDSDLDDHGRVVIPAQLRRKLNLENQEISMDCTPGRVALYDQRLYEEKLAKFTEDLPGALEKIEQAGLL